MILFHSHYMKTILNTPTKSIFYEDDRIIAALAYEPITKGHTVVIWKEDVEDLSSLDTKDYAYLMELVDVTRNTLMEFYGVEKVYLMYLDEIKHVHWHLVPRYDEKGFNVLKHKPSHTDTFENIEQLALLFKRTKEEISD